MDIKTCSTLYPFESKGLLIYVQCSQVHIKMSVSAEIIVKVNDLLHKNGNNWLSENIRNNHNSKYHLFFLLRINVMICNENNIEVHIDNHHLLLNYNADNIKIINDDNINK